MTPGAGAADAVGASGPPDTDSLPPVPEWPRQHKDRRGWVPGVAVAV